MSADQDGSVGKDGGWAATEKPQGFYWGGTWITAATGTDNPTLVADIMRTMTTNVDVMKEIVTADNDFINNKPAMEEMASRRKLRRCCSWRTEPTGNVLCRCRQDRPQQYEHLRSGLQRGIPERYEELL